MNYYPFHVGDYAVDTRYLTLMQDLAYRRLIDLYYTRELPIPLDVEEAARKIGMTEHVGDVQLVLRDFFQQAEDGYRHKRCDEEIATYKAKAERARAANHRRWDDKKYETDLKSDTKSDLKSDADQILTNNQEPITNNQKKNKRHNASYDAIPDLVAAGVDRQKAIDWLAVRKTKRAAETKTAIEGVLKNIAAYGISADEGIQICCERGWAGFEGAWLAPRTSAAVRPLPTSTNAAVMERWLAKKAQEVA